MSVKLSGDGVDPADLTSLLFRPQRPALASALECVYAMPSEIAEDAARSAELRWDEAAGWIHWKSADGSPRKFRADRGHFDAEQAWEAVVSHGLLNDDWLASAERRFLTSALHRAQLDAGMAPKHLPHPHTLKSCVLVAADGRAMQTVEALAREACAALAPWGHSARRAPLLWQFDEQSVFQQRFVDPYAMSPPKKLAIDANEDPWRCAVAARATAALIRASRAIGLVNERDRTLPTSKPPAPWRDRHLRAAFVTASDAHRWERAVAKDRTIVATETDPGFPAVLVGQSFASLPNPFAPLATLYTLGYAVESLDDELHFVAIEP